MADFALSVDEGTYELTAGGEDRLVHSVTAPPGEYALTGADVELVGTFTLAADEGLYQFRGDEVSLPTNPGIGLEDGSYQLRGGDVWLRTGPLPGGITHLRRRRRR